MLEVNYFVEEHDFDLGQHQSLFSRFESTLKDLIIRHENRVFDLSYVFCSDDYLLEVNKTHLNHDYYTDIITFVNIDQPTDIQSDMFISIDRIQDHSSQYKVPFEEELLRVMFHGVLHLLGFNDKTEDEAKEMRRQEALCLAAYQKGSL